MTYRLGGAYQLGDYAFFDNAALRLGAAYDATPVPDSTIDPTLPDADRLIFTAGLGHKIGPMSIDLAYMAVMVEERSVETSRTFPTKATYPSRLIHLAAASFGYEF